jgi:hypothetical protein
MIVLRALGTQIRPVLLHVTQALLATGLTEYHSPARGDIGDVGQMEC